MTSFTLKPPPPSKLRSEWGGGRGGAGGVFLFQSADTSVKSDDLWASCYVYVHPVGAHASWQTISEEQLTIQGLAREMREQGKSQVTYRY
jgi:hypothetical protein